jgi:hypothetical protein
VFQGGRGTLWSESVEMYRRGWAGFAHHVRYEVGDSSKVLFWHDVWCGELPLEILFPELFTIACDKDAWMKENMQIQNGNIHWNILFTRLVHDWEVDVVSRFFELLYSKSKVWKRGYNLLDSIEKEVI